MENQKKASGKKWVVILCVVLALVLIGGGAACVYHFIFNSPEKKYEKAMSSAAEFMDEEEYKDAIEYFREALEYEEDDEDALEGIAEAYKKLGDSYLKKEDYEKAYSNYKKAFKDVENKDAMEAALKLCYEQAKKAGEDFDFGAQEEWVAKYDELAEELDKDDFYTAYMAELLDPEYNKPAVVEPEVVEPEVIEPEVVEPVIKTIDLWAFTDEVPKMVDYFVKTHPDFPYEIRTTIIATTDGMYQPALDEALRAGDNWSPDIYCVESAFAYKYIKGDFSGYAATYEELGIDVDSKIQEAKIGDFIVDMGTRPTDGEVVALGYQSGAGAFIYRRSVAIDTWGTDDPAVVQEKIGGGSGNWDQFFVAAEELKAKGYAIVSGEGDVWRAVENSADKGWFVDGKLHIDPKREAFLDIAKALEENDYHNSTMDWSDAWFADMKGQGEKEVLGFFGPTWLINYTMKPNCGGSVYGEGTYGDWAVCLPPVGFNWGGTWILANRYSDVQEGVAEIIEWLTLDCSEDGLQYAWANGTAEWMYYYDSPIKDAVASSTVMEMSNGEMDFLSGQNMFDVYAPANHYANANVVGPFDESINDAFRQVVREYASGAYTRDEALQMFKDTVYNRIGISAE